MRVLILTPSFGTGGAEGQTALLATGLARRGHDVRVVALGEGGHRVEEARGAGVGVEVLGMRGPLDVVPALRSATLRGFRPEILLSSGVNGLYIGSVLARIARAPHLYNEHRGVGVELSRRRRAMMGLLARSLAGVVLVSEDQRREWLAHGVAPARVHTVPNGVAPPSGADPASVRAELGIGPTGIAALCVATLKPLKRVGDFIAAVTAARARVPELTGLVAGDGPERPALEAAIAAAGGPGGPGGAGVRLLGLRDDVPRLLRAADIFVLPSDREAMPMAILEAMANGLPVIATPVGAVPAMVGVDAGLLSPAGDRDALIENLVRLARDAELRDRLGAAGRRRVQERWSAETMTERYERIFTAAAGAGAPGL